MLTDYEGQPVGRSSIRIVRAGDGLSEPLAIDSREFHLGDRVQVVLDCEVTDVAFRPIRDLDMLDRRHTLTAILGTVVDKAVVGELLEAQREAIDKAKGVERLPIDGDGDQ